MHNNVGSKLAEEVRLRRLKINKTQEEIADQMGTGQTRVSEIENGEANPTLKTLEKLAGALCCNLIIKLENK